MAESPLPASRESFSSPVTRALDDRALPYRVFHHPGPLRSLEQAAEERGQRPGQVVRSILFRLGQGEYMMALIAGPGQISWPALRRRLGVSRLTLASEDEVLAATGYPRGAVSPLGLPAPVRILVDRSVLAEEEISLGSGVRSVAVILKSEDLLKALEPVMVGEFAG